MFGFAKPESPTKLYQRIAIALFCVAVVVVVVLLVMRVSRGPARNTHVSPFESGSKAESDRLTIMNILNRYNAGENALQGKKKEASVKSRVERMSTAEEQLRALTVDDSLTAARDRLVVAFALWREKLSANQDLAPVREQFIAVGTEYAWLNTLVWLIVLNRL